MLLGAVLGAVLGGVLGGSLSGHNREHSTLTDPLTTRTITKGMASLPMVVEDESNFHAPVNHRKQYHVG